MANSGLLPPRGDRASTATGSSSSMRSSSSSLNTSGRLSSTSRSSKSRRTTTSSSSSSSEDASSSLASTIQGSFRATNSQGLLNHSQKVSVRSSRTEDDLHGSSCSLNTTGVLVAAMSSANKDSLLATATSSSTSSSGDLDTITIQGSFRVSKSQGLHPSLEFCSPMKSTKPAPSSTAHPPFERDDTLDSSSKEEQQSTAAAAAAGRVS
ncbi:hypothetical protein Esti_000671 [Eimeria stiedai]